MDDVKLDVELVWLPLMELQMVQLRFGELGVTRGLTIPEAQALRDRLIALDLDAAVAAGGGEGDRNPTTP